MPNLKSYFLLLLLGLGSHELLLAQDYSCTDDPLYSKLDFWVGDWEVYNEDGELIGTNSIRKILKGCAIEEKWTGQGGGKGQSLFFVDNDTRKWNQIWVTERAKNPGGQKHKMLIEEIDNGAIRFQGSYIYLGDTILDRTTLTPNTDGSVIQLIETSTDDGETWKVGFSGIYRKKN